MNVLVVDDEPLARRRLIRLLGSIPDTRVVGEAGDGIEALAKIRELSPDVVLLDIRMPGKDGLTLATEEPDLPPIVFTTAYDDYALAAFDAAAVDYLLKPVKLARLERALSRVRQRSAAEAVSAAEAMRRAAEVEQQPSTARLVAQEGTTSYLFDARKVARLYAADKYTVLHHESRDYLIEESLRELETRLGEHGFFRCHRAELVNLHFARALRADPQGALLDLTDGQVARVSRRQIAALRRALDLRAG